MKYTREIPGAGNTFLRFQTGSIETRPERIPCYDGERVVGERATGALVSVFRLLGFGETVQQSERMAMRK